MPPIRRFAETLVLTLSSLLLLQAFVIAVYQVPGGSMAPTLHGQHHAGTCPRCGYPVQVGAGRDTENAACPNCDLRPLPLEAAEESGDRLLVLQHAFAWWSPTRWEVVVFRWLGEWFIKRVVGLPGETVALRDGDVYINGALVRKTLAETRTLRVPVFDSAYVPSPHTWRDRWESTPATNSLESWQNALHLESATADTWHWLTYRHFSLDAQKEQPLCDEYAYNGGARVSLTPVHDFLVECEVEILSQTGTLLLGLTDGQDVVAAEIGISSDRDTRSASRLRVVRDDKFPLQPGPTALPAQSQQPRTPTLLKSGHTHRLEFAFVDRRVSLAIDGREPFAALDLPPATRRAAVTHPLVLGVQHGRVVVRRVRLFRDLHYTDAGRNAVRGQVVRLGPDQYFVLGDNSPRSQDSRSWPEGGVVSSAQLLGKPLWLPERWR